ncbi:hypothetical protein [Dactylosporangium sp. CA-233914]|uniref:hypothetical protein n=1 Tax=Dactylosporangium sp. CA-233914 TaxID=3239934 RepID=UPI003D92FCA6
MPRTATLLLTKALHLLDRGALPRAEAVLREAVAAAEAAVDPVTRVRALCCLGELLTAQNRPVEAEAALTACLRVPLPDDLDDACEAERERARALLGRVSP